jgi:hypothetical protein
MRTLFTLFFLTISLQTIAQDNDRRERIKSLKIAYLTEQLALTSTEAQKFWPIYNAFEENEQLLRRENYSKRRETNFESLGEQEANKMIEEMLSTEKKKHELRENFIKDLQKILPSKKILKLKIAEDQFNKRMFEELKKRRDLRKEKP